MTENQETLEKQVLDLQKQIESLKREQIEKQEKNREMSVSIELEIENQNLKIINSNYEKQVAVFKRQNSELMKQLQSSCAMGDKR